MTNIITRASQYWTGTKNAVQNFTQNHPNMTKAAVFATSIISGYALLNWATNNDIVEECAPRQCHEIIESVCDQAYQCCTDIFNACLAGYNTTYDVQLQLTDKCIPEVCSEVYPLKRQLQLLQELVSETDQTILSAGLYPGATLDFKILSRFSDYALADYGQKSAWGKALTGAMYYPFAIYAGLLAQLGAGIGAIAGYWIGEGYLANHYVMSATVPVEEFIFRVLIQDVLLKKLPQAILNKISPELADKVNSNGAKIMRVALSSIAFSLFHLINLKIYSEDVVTLQLANTLGVGLICGFLQEKTGDAWAALGLHLAFNNINTLKLELNTCEVNEPSLGVN